jgi:hypothetical protein
VVAERVHRVLLLAEALPLVKEIKELIRTYNFQLVRHTHRLVVVVVEVETEQVQERRVDLVVVVELVTTQRRDQAVAQEQDLE